MKKVNKNIISAADTSTTVSAAIDTNQWVSASFAASFGGDTQATGTFKLQASNDPAPEGYDAIQSGFTPTNWVDVPTQSASVTTGTSALLTISNMCYRWLRASFTPTAAAVQTVTVSADVAGSLNNKYFLIGAGNAGINYYVWFNVNSAGTDPMIANKTGVEVALATGATANDVADAVAAALDALAAFVAPNPAANVITVTNATSGPFTPASAGTTTFTFAVTAGGNGTATVNMFGLSV